MHDPLPPDSFMRQDVPLMVTVPVGMVPENCGETLTERRSLCSCPKVTFAADSFRVVLVEALATVKVVLVVNDVEPKKLVLGA
jgi:hypothetical protein